MNPFFTTNSKLLSAIEIPTESEQKLEERQEDVISSLAPPVPQKRELRKLFDSKADFSKRNIKRMLKLREVFT
jgi:hypothetical protein